MASANLYLQTLNHFKPNSLSPCPKVPPFPFFKPYQRTSRLHCLNRANSKVLRSRTSTNGNARIMGAFISPPAPDPYTRGFESGGFAEQSYLGAKAAPPLSWGLIGTLLIKHRLRIAVSVVSLLGCTACILSMPLLSGKFFEVLIGKRPESLWDVLTKVGVLYILEPIFTIIFVINMNTMWEKVMKALRVRIFGRILVQKVEFFDRYKVGELTGLLTSDLGSLKDVVSENISRDRGFRAFSEVMGTICILFSLSIQLAPVLGLLMLSVSGFVAMYKRSTVPLFKAHGLAQARISDCATETFSAIRTVRSFSGEKRQMSMFINQILPYKISGMKLGILKSANESLTRVMVYISLMALYCLGGSKVKAGELSLGTMTSFIGYTFTLTFAVQGCVNTLGDLRGTLAAVERINSVLTGSEIDESLAYGLERDAQRGSLDIGNLGSLYKDGEYLQSPITHYRLEKTTSSGYHLAWSGDVCLEDVYFSYPLRSDVDVLNGLNLTLKCGTITALVGPSGAGKSTIVQLLARFYEPTKGRITVGGEDVRAFDKSEWARAISIVNQDPILFSVSVGENIAYGLPDEDVSKEDIVEAAKAANAHDFIISLPQGYDTPVGERGGLLSGGQRQRIAIARALLKNAPILILDEATSALDAVSERLVQGALNHLMKGRTTLVIAHRLSTVQNAHQIALCSQGKITELGSHSELLALKGQYASLVDTQRLAFE
ncbi:ABC transporter B family member 28 [Amborella trichopoda]|nr:ABC transporter B family member 28 [Amborella trichopoda]|eukprot:XP_020531380.1 ABC transporter B family member 28 [Amborella trichopoda]